MSRATGAAESAITGLPLTEDNYETAIDILRDRFGKPQLLISNHMEALLKLPIVSPRGGTLGISGWGCAAGTLEPLTYTRASSAEFCYPILE